MKPIDQILLIERIDGLIRRKQTGNAKELADRLGVSERTIFRLISDLRDMGLPVKYSHSSRSYFYDGETPLHIRITWNFLDERK